MGTCSWSAPKNTQEALCGGEERTCRATPQGRFQNRPRLCRSCSGVLLQHFPLKTEVSCWGGTSAERDCSEKFWFQTESWHDNAKKNHEASPKVSRPGLALDGRNHAIVLAKVVAAIRITSVRWRSHLPPNHKLVVTDPPCVRCAAVCITPLTFIHVTVAPYGIAEWLARVSGISKPPVKTRWLVTGDPVPSQGLPQ